MSENLPLPVALVTGAGRGIGRATAVAFAKAGFATVLVARNVAELTETKSLCGDNAVVEIADVRDGPRADAIVAGTVARFGRIDVLVNNAGLAPLVAFEKMTEQIFRDTIDTNLLAAFHYSRAVWPVMQRQGGGTIINLSSESARDPFDGFAAYAAAKAAINAFTKALASEGDAHHIRAIAVAPAGVETAMLRKIATPEQLRPADVLTPQDVADAILAAATGPLRHASGEVIYLHKRA
ncbi:MAG TPA: SDR family oxidoreductase [Tepidisphaeraceae bacterium]|jgi:3-oxoacyl-[acyl-carrier protein] reductase